MSRKLRRPHSTTCGNSAATPDDGATTAMVSPVRRRRGRRIRRTYRGPVRSRKREHLAPPPFSDFRTNVEVVREFGVR